MIADIVVDVDDVARDVTWIDLNGGWVFCRLARLQIPHTA
ncbi:hypothetical protein ABID25_006706 [Mesorhizobium abyssinicae]